MWKDEEDVVLNDDGLKSLLITNVNDEKLLQTKVVICMTHVFICTLLASEFTLKQVVTKELRFSEKGGAILNPTPSQYYFY